MAPRYEVELNVLYGRDLKNVNWRHGDLKPYVVVWIDPAAKVSTKVAVDGDTDPVWEDKIVLPLPPGKYIDDSTLFIDVVHAGSSEDTKPLVGSARLPLREVVDDAGIGGKAARTLKLKRPSGRPQGKLELKVAVKEPARYYDPYAPPPPPAGYGYNQSSSRENYGGGYGYGQPYSAAAPPAGYPYSAPPPPQPAGYGYGGAPPSSAGYGAPPSSAGFGGPPSSAGYGAPLSAAGYGGAGYGAAAPPVVVEEKKKSKFGMGTGLAVGAAAGVLGGIVLAEGFDHLEDKIADDAADKAEADMAREDYGGDNYDGGDYYDGGDDDY